MKKINKPISVLLAVLMIVSLFTIVPFTASAATASDAHFSQDGDTYTIHDADGWGVFCDLLAENDKGYFTDKTVLLGADIEVTRMAGSSHHDFTGTFDGQKHTLTFNYGTSTVYANDQYTAPFRYVETGCNIENLHVDGDIYTTAKNASGLIGSQYGSINIKNCRVSSVIHSDVNGDGTHAGFVATNADTAGSSITIEGCLFDGKMLTGSANITGNCAGFVGWQNKDVTITNSIYDPAAIADGETEVVPGTGKSPSCTFVRNGAAGDNCYYTRALGSVENQGKQAYSITAGENVSLALKGTATVYSVSGITA